jgi:hypothetical protein
MCLAVIAGNMENPGKRLTVLEGDEVEALYGHPCFTHGPLRASAANPQGLFDSSPVVGGSLVNTATVVPTGHKIKGRSVGAGMTCCLKNKPDDQF